MKISLPPRGRESGRGSTGRWFDTERWPEYRLLKIAKLVRSGGSIGQTDNKIRKFSATCARFG